MTYTETYTEAHTFVKGFPWAKKMAWARPNWDDHYRPNALAELEEYLAGTGQGISSSDVNHVAMSNIEQDLIRGIIHEAWCDNCEGTGQSTHYSCPVCEGTKVTQDLAALP